MSHNFKELAMAIKSQGVEHAFGITGSGNSLSLITALQQVGVQYHPVFHEAAATLMAGGCCSDGQTRAVAISIKGPGFINMMPGQLSNLYEGRPVVSISEAYVGDAPSFLRHKRLDHAQITEPLTKAYTRANDVRDINQVFQMARQENPGPVHMDLSPKPEHEIKRHKSADQITPVIPDLDDIHIKIQQSERPVVILGSWAKRNAINVDWNKLKIPVVTTAAAKGTYDETKPYSGGVVTGEESDYSPEQNIIAQADLLISFGLRNHEVIKAAPNDCYSIMIDQIASQATEGFEPDDVVLVDGADELSPIFQSLLSKQWGIKNLEAWRLKINNVVLSGHKWQAGVVYRQLQASIPSARLVLDTGFFCTVGETIWQAQHKSSFVGSSVGRFMGVALPTAIGLAIQNPLSPVICVVGDGGLPPYVSEIKLAVKENLPIIFVLMSDGGYGSIRAFSDKSQFALQAIEISAVGWSEAIAKMGCPSHLIDNNDSLANVLLGWAIEQGPLFLETHFDAQNYADIAKKLR